MKKEFNERPGTYIRNDKVSRRNDSPFKKVGHSSYSEARFKRREGRRSDNDTNCRKPDQKRISKSGKIKLVNSRGTIQTVFNRRKNRIITIKHMPGGVSKLSQMQQQLAMMEEQFAKAGE